MLCRVQASEPSCWFCALDAGCYYGLYAPESVKIYRDNWSNTSKAEVLDDDIGGTEVVTDGSYLGSYGGYVALIALVSRQG